MFGTVKAVRVIQGRFHAGGAGIVRRSGDRRALKRSLRTYAGARPSMEIRLSTNPHQKTAVATFSTTERAGQVVPRGNVPRTADAVLDRFLACVEKQDANGAMAHFAFIACERGPLVTLRRRQLLVMLCEKGMVKEASELLTNATASATFDSQDLSTIASFMYVMCGCLRHGDVDRALVHFRQASDSGIGLDLPLCEGLATALFIKALRGEAAEMQAWDVLEYIRQRGMVHRPEVCDHALLYATASDDLSFALRMCQYMDEEGLWCDLDVRDALCRSVAMAIRRLPETAAVSTDGGGEGGSWVVEGTNATVEELWALNTLLHRWLDTEMEEADDGDLDEEEVFRLEGDSKDEEGSDEGREDDGADGFADVVDYDSGDMHILGVDDMENATADVVDFEDGLDHDHDSLVGHLDSALGAPPSAGVGETPALEDEPTVDWGGGQLSGDLMDQMAALYPEKEGVSFEADDDEMGSFSAHGRRGRRGRGGGDYLDQRERSVYADLVMPYGDPHGEGEQGIMSIPVKISVGHEDENSDDDDDDDDEAGPSV